ncbi:hypothetical protein J4526_04390 [Desulfurococcaceae archaeon MEX13E-LK6-19]|nr:hypothetical protein J4526_04390 [Desulfurococcaceae archaeon MEX13E-LK6-19]
MSKKNYILVTCKAGNEEWCEEEVGNVLYILDPEINIKRTKYKGVLIVETKIDVDKAYRMLISREYGFVKRVIPFHIVTRPDVNEITALVKELVEKQGYKGPVRLQIVFRGIRGLSNILWNKLKRELAAIGVIIDRNAKKCIYIESVDELVGIGFVDCWPS